MSEQWLSVSEFAFATGWSEDVIRRRIYDGEIKTVILPQRNKGKKRYRSIRILYSELERFLKRFGNAA